MEFIMANLYLLVVTAFGTGEVAGAAGGVGGDDGSLVIVVDVAAFFALLTVSDNSAPLVHDDPTCNLYGQRATSEKASMRAG